jgi:nicotinamide-nucleotide adenylyltransferase
MVVFKETRISVTPELNPRLKLRLRDHLQPPPLSDEELFTLMELGIPPNTYGIGLVIGRFQPPHYGHLFLMMQALKVCDRIVIGIGSANVINYKNPFPVDIREKLLREAIHDLGIGSRVTQIARLNDFNNDQQWFENTLLQVGQFNVVVGNNEEGVNRVFRERGIPAIQTPLFERSTFRGERIRGELIAEGLLGQIT